jgi:hypothetical protein
MLTRLCAVQGGDLHFDPILALTALALQTTGLSYSNITKMYLGMNINALPRRYSP